MIQHVVEFEGGAVGKIVTMYDAEARETHNRIAADAIVVELPDGTVLHGEVECFEGLHPVQ
jgi:hypothetical protein